MADTKCVSTRLGAREESIESKRRLSAVKRLAEVYVGFVERHAKLLLYETRDS
jgi:hypothetical protein